MGPPTKRSVEGNHQKGKEATFSSAPPIPSQKALTCKRGGEEVGQGRKVGRGGKMAGGCGKVTVIIANPTVGPVGCRGWAICFGGSQSGGSSDLPWEAKPHRRNSSRLVKSRRPGSTGLAQLLFGRSSSSKRALSSLSGNSPSHG